MHLNRGQAAAATAIFLALAALAVWLAADGDPAARNPDPLFQSEAAPPDAPNLIVVMVDDESVSMHDRKAMPAVTGFFAKDGTAFNQAVAAPPLCCPSRAGFLTGRYSTHHGVVENQVGYRSLKGKDATFPVALQAASYRTAMIGKFLNGYEPAHGAAPAPGFDRWYAIHGYADYFDFQVSDNGTIKTDPGYATESLTSRAIEFVEAASSTEDPFFLWLSYNAPHTINGGYKKPCNGRSAQPSDPLAYRPFRREELPRPPSFNQRLVAGSPALAGTRSLGAKKIRATTRAWRCARAALAGIDDGFARLAEALRRDDLLDDTVVVYLSDNGYYYGEHRLVDDKRLPLEPALAVPMAIRVGRNVADQGPAATNALVSQVDLAPTLLDYAGVDHCPGDRHCPAIDGRSLRPLLEGDDERWPSNRALPMTLDDGWNYAAIRTPRYLYMEVSASRKREYRQPKLELYDLRTDPHQLENIAGNAAAAAQEATLAQRLRALVTHP